MVIAGECSMERSFPTRLAESHQFALRRPSNADAYFVLNIRMLTNPCGAALGREFGLP